MAQIYGRNNLAIFAYGSLLADPREKIATHIVDRIPYPSPWPIESPGGRNCAVMVRPWSFARPEESCKVTSWSWILGSVRLMK